MYDVSFVTFKICSSARLSVDTWGRKSARLWRDNVKIQLHNLKGDPGLSHYIYLGSKRLCSLSIHLSQHLLWVDEVISLSFIFCFGCCFLHQMSLNALFMGVYLFSDIQSIFQRARGPRWESHGTISVMHMRLKELGCVWFQQETTRVLHYGMDARWQHCSAMLEPDKVGFWLLLNCCALK